MQNSKETPESLSYKRIIILWLPLAAMWLMMGIEMPLINAVIARLPEAKLNLAAFGVTLAIALIVEAPIIQLLAAGTALADSAENYGRLLRFTHLLALTLTVFHLFLGLTPLYTLFLRHVLAVPPEIIEISRRAFLWMFPWSAAVAYRRFWQGVLIRYKKTSPLPLVMVIRFCFTTAVLLSGFVLPGLSAAEIGGMALSFGVIAGAVSCYLFVRPIVRKMEDHESVRRLEWNELYRFYYPLALTSFMTFIVRPVLSFGIARALYPLESLAIWPVVTSVLFLFRSTAMAYQEVAVSLLKDEQDRELLSRFALLLGSLLSAVLFLLAITPLGALLYRHGSGLGHELLSFTVIPTYVVVPVPLITSLISWYRGFLIYKHETQTIARAVFLNSVVLVLIIMGGPFLMDLPGGVFASIAYAGSLGMELLYLRSRLRLVSSPVSA